ncbi:MAG: aspartate/glutamate racemase family protein [Pseudomonadota bacterium]
MTQFDYTLDAPLGSRARMGLIVLQADQTLEHDMRRTICDPDVALYTTRVPSGADVTPDTLAAMAQDLPRAAGLLPPLRYDVVGYGCTSGTAVIGAEKVAAQIRQGCDARAVTEPLSALIALCAARGTARLAFLSPYIAPVSARLREALAAQGIETPVFGSFAEAEESKVARISQASLYTAAMALGRAPEAEAVVLSCTNLRTLEIIPRIEADLGKPVFSSNQALMWHMRVLAGLER